MALNHIGPSEIAKLRQLIEDGVKVKQEIQTLTEGLSETVKDIGKELDIKPSLLNRAIRSNFKSSIGEERDDLDTIEEILEVIKQRSAQ